MDLATHYLLRQMAVTASSDRRAKLVKGAYLVPILSALLLPACAMAQQSPAQVRADTLLPPTTRPTTAPSDPLVTLNFPDNTPLTALISYVSERLGIDFVYDETIANQTIVLRMPAPVHQSQLLEVLANALQSKNLILEDTSVPQLKRISQAQMALTVPPVMARPDAPAAGSQMVTSFHAMHHVRAEQVLQPVLSMLSRPNGRAAILADKQALVVTDYASNVQRVADFLKVVDVAAEKPTIRAVAIRNGSAQRMAATLQALVQQANVQGAGGPPMQGMTVVVADDSSNQVILSGPSDIVAGLVELVEKLDAPRDAPQTTCFYKLVNTVAADVLATLRSLEGEGNGPPVAATKTPKPVPGAVPAFGQPLPQANGQNGDVRTQVSPDVSGAGAKDNRSTAAIIAADENTNTIIVVATTQQQEMYEQIIHKLDQRRPQVMIETTVVALDTSNGFSLGVDIAGNYNDGKIITFSSFGVATVNALKGTLTPRNAPGGTLALLNPDVADVVVNALATSTHARLVSMPRVLVNDNSIGKLQSVQQEPFQRTVVTNSTTIVGEGDNAEAGTSIEVTPHISNGDYLQLEYAVELSAFTGTAQNNLPPPSQRNSVSSKVTIPDGNTIVVGGLNRSSYTDSVNAIPILGQIPIIEYLFSSRSKQESNTTLFVFIRPTILRDDEFRDLKYLSAVDRKASKVPDDLPTSEPLIMHVQ